MACCRGSFILVSENDYNCLQKGVQGCHTFTHTIDAFKSTLQHQKLVCCGKYSGPCTEYSNEVQHV